MKHKKWLLPIAFSFISWMSFLFIGYGIPFLILGDNRDLGGVVIVIIGLCAWVIVAIPIISSVCSRKTLTEVNNKALFSLYNTFWICQPVLFILFNAIMSGELAFIVAVLFVIVWCYIWQRLEIIRINSKNFEEK